MISILTIPAVFYICLAAYSLSLTVNALRKLRIYKIADYLLVFMLGLFLLITVILFGSELNWWNFLGQGIRLRLPWYALLLFSGVIFGLTSAVFRTENPGWAWLIISLVIISIVIAADAMCIFPGDLNWGRQQEGYIHSILSTVIQAVGWGFFVILSSIQVLQEYRATDRTSLAK
jgi:hypothetical protein